MFCFCRKIALLFGVASFCFGAFAEEKKLTLLEEVCWSIQGENEQPYWFSLECSGNQKYKVTTFGSKVDTELILQAYNEDTEQWEELQRNDDALGLTSALEFIPEQQNQYRVGVVSSEMGEASLRMRRVVLPCVPWIPIDPPVNEMRSEALLLTGEVPLLVDVNFAGAQIGHELLQGAAVWYSWQCPEDWGQDWLSLQVRQGVGVQSAVIQQGKNNALAVSNGSQLLFQPRANVTYDFACSSGFSRQQSSVLLELLVANEVPNLSWGSAMVLEGEESICVIQDAADFFSESAIQEDSQLGFWYSFEAEQDGTLSVTTMGSNFDTVLHSYSEEDGRLSQTGQDDDGGENTTSMLELEVMQGETVLLFVRGYSQIGRVQLNTMFLPR